MKHILFAGGTVLLMATMVQAHPTIHFSTEVGAAYSWTLARVDTSWQLSFAVNDTVVDETIPDDAVLLGDYVNLPTINITGLVDHGTFITGAFEPTGDLTIVSQPGGAEVFGGSLGTGGTFVAGTNWFAFQDIADDLTVGSHTAAYSSVLDEIVARGGDPLFLLDFNIAGTSENDVYQTLRSGQGSIVGNLAGTIHAVAIPAPGALLLTSIGTAAIGLVRRRRHR